MNILEGLGKNEKVGVEGVPYGFHTLNPTELACILKWRPVSYRYDPFDCCEEHGIEDDDGNEDENVMVWFDNGFPVLFSLDNDGHLSACLGIPEEREEDSEDDEEDEN